MSRPSGEDLARKVNRYLEGRFREWDRRATFSVVPNSEGNVHVFVRSRRLAAIQELKGADAAREALGLESEFPVKVLSRIKIRAGA